MRFVLLLLALHLPATSSFSETPAAIPPSSFTPSAKVTSSTIPFQTPTSLLATAPSQPPAFPPSPPPPSSFLARTRSLSPVVQRTNLLSGGTVSLAMIPEAVGFAFVAGVSPLCGLWTTVIMGMMSALFGGRPGIMTGASGAVAVVVAPLVASHGKAFLAPTVLLAGLIQLAAGKLKLGEWIRLVPHPVMLGFVNGLAVVMTRAQLVHFKDPVTGLFLSLTSPAGATMAGLTVLSMLFMKLTPLVTTLLPPSLVTIVLTTLAAKVFKLPARTLMDIAGASTFTGGLSSLPRFALPFTKALGVPFTRSTLRVILPVALTVATVGLIESLLTLQLLDTIADSDTPSSTALECRGQGLGNAAASLFGGMGGCALIGQSIMNAEAGGVERLSGVAMSLSLGVGIVAFAPLLGMIPISALVGVMLLVCQSTFAWPSLRILHKVPRLDAFIILLVTYITVVQDLAVATAAGTVLSALSFAWKQSAAVNLSRDGPVYKLSGPIFFGSAQTFQRLFEPEKDTTGDKAVTLDFADARLYDHSALEAVNGVVSRFGAAGKTVTLANLSSNCKALLDGMNASGSGAETGEEGGERAPVDATV